MTGREQHEDQAWRRHRLSLAALRRVRGREGGDLVVRASVPNPGRGARDVVGASACRGRRGDGGDGTDTQRVGAAGSVVPPPGRGGGARAARSSRPICGTTSPSTPRPTGSTPSCWPGCRCCTPRGCTWPKRSVPGDPLKRAVKIRAGLVHRRSTAMARLDSLLEILGPGWIDALGTRMTQTTFKFLASYAHPHQVKRLGAARLARWFQHHSRKAWGPLCKRPGSWWSEVGVDAVGVDECELFEGLLPVRGDLALYEAAGGLALCSR